MKVQDALEVMSGRKRFHVIVFALLALNFMFIPIHIFVDLFLSYEPKHYCAYPQGGSKYQWIPYNHETHSFDSCAIYEEPLTKELEKAEKKRIEEESYHNDLKVWDWKALKFKSKHYHDDDSHSDHPADDPDDHSDPQGHEGQDSKGHKGHEGETSDAHRRRRREQPRPAAAESKSARDSHRFVTDDGRVLEASQLPGAFPDDTNVSSGVTGAPETATVASTDTTDAPSVVADAPEDVTDPSSPDDEDDAEDAEDAAAGEEEPATEAETSTNSSPTFSEADATTEPVKVEAEDDTDHDADDVTEPDHPEEEVIVHSFSGTNGDRSLLGAGIAGSLVPEYDVSDEVTAGDQDNTKTKDNPQQDGDNALREAASEEAAGSPLKLLPGEVPAHALTPHDDAGHGVDHDDRDGADDKLDESHGDGHGDDRGHDDGGDDLDSAHPSDAGVPHASATSDHSDSGRGNDHAKGHDDKGVKKASSKHQGEHKATSYGQYGHSKYLHRTVSCQHGIHYLADVGTTLITEYGLSCRNDVSVITNTVVGTAMVAGAIIFAPFVDKYGRKTLFMMVCCQNCLISLGIAFVGDIRSYWVLRFLSRFYIEGVEIALLVLAVEMAPTKSRPIAPLILYVAYAIGQILLSLQAMLFRSWWKLQLAISVESILLIPFSWFLMPESIQWLVSMRRHQEAEKLIRLGCRLNGIILPSDFKLDKADHEDGEGSDDDAAGNGHAHGHGPRKSAAERLRSTQLNLKNRPGTGEYLQHEFHAHIGEWRKILDLMKNHQLRRHFFIVSYMWAIVGFLYYGLTASTMVMKGNVYLNYCLSGLVMVPASVSIFILRRFGRKKPIFYFLIGAGIFIILSVTCPYKTPDGVDMYPVYLAIKLMAKYCVVSCLISIRLLIIELFPTPVRGTLIGLTALIGLLGSALGYYFLELITFSKWVGVVVGVLTILAAFLSRMLPETSHRPLPDTINDMMAACREMFLNLLVAMPNMPRPEPPPAPTPQPRPKRNMSALSAFSAVLSWRSRSKSGAGGGDGAPLRSMSEEDFKRPPHLPLSSMTSSPLPRGDTVDEEAAERPAPALRSLVQRVRAAEPHRPSLRERMSRALSQRRTEQDTLEVAPRRARRTSSTPSMASAARRYGVDNPQYEQETPKVSFDLVRADSQGLASNGLEGGLSTVGLGDGGGGERGGQGEGTGSGEGAGSVERAGSVDGTGSGDGALSEQTDTGDTAPAATAQATTHF